METKETVAAWHYKNEDEKQLAEYIIGLEEFEKWFKGDTSGYAGL